MGLFSRLKHIVGAGRVRPAAQSAKSPQPEPAAAPSPESKPAAPPTNRSLVEAMNLVITEDNVANRRRLYQVIRKSTLLIACDDQTAEAALKHGELDAGGEFNLVVIAGPQNQTILPVFSDEQALLAWSPKGSAYLWMNGADLLTLLEQNRTDALSINPAGPVGGVIDGQDLRNLLRGPMRD